MMRIAEEISADELAERLETGVLLQILDVRAPEHVAAGHIELVPAERFRNVRGSAVLAAVHPADVGISAAMPTVVVCGHGNDSAKVARHLREHGYNASSLKGGMAAWMSVVIPRALEAPSSLDALFQLDRPGKGSLGYLLIGNHEALIIDPPRDLDVYLHLLDESGARLIGVADTHVHADYISGGPCLSKELGIPYYLHPADAVYPYDGTPGRTSITPIADGDIIKVGRAGVVVAHTPGHTEGSVTYLLDGAAAFTGDFLFVDSVGRPDLAGKTREWTDLLWKSIEGTRSRFSPGLMVYPAHYSSERERRIGRAVGAPLGELLKDNSGLRLRDVRAFARWVGENVTTFPEAYRKIKAINVGLLEVSDAELEELESGRNACALGTGT